MRITLRAQGSTDAELCAEWIAVGRRRASALGRLIGWWVLVPLVALVPPHIPWAVGAFVLGIYFFVRQWRGELVVRSFSGRCPRCESALTIPPGARVRLPHKVICSGCHFEPVVQAAAAPRAGAGR